MKITVTYSIKNDQGGVVLQKRYDCGSWDARDGELIIYNDDGEPAKFSKADPVNLLPGMLVCPARPPTMMAVWARGSWLTVEQEAAE